MTSEATGARRTKKCYQCDEVKDVSDFNANPAHKDGLTTQCGECERINAHVKNPRINAISSLAYKIAGSSKQFYALPKINRIATRAQATELYELGADIVLATTAQAAVKQGFVYVITHPSWPGYVKIGRAFDPQSRLNGYQTGCPHRAYELKHSVYFHNCVKAEKEMHMRLAPLRQEGEWFALNAAVAANHIDNLREVI